MQEDISVGRLGEPPTIEDKDQLASKISSKLSLGRATDGRSGFDRIKDAVGRRSHAVRMPLDGQTGHGEDKIISSNHFHGRKRNLKLDNTQQAVGGSEGSRKIASRQMGYDHSQGVLRDEIGESTEDDSSHSGAEPLSVTDEPLSNLKKTPVLRDSSKQSTREPSLVLSVDGTEGLPVSQYSSDETRPDKLLFRRTHSYSALDAAPKSTSKDDWWPRNLSFSIAEDSVLLWRPLIDIQARDATLDPDQVGQPFRAELFMQDFSRKWSKIELVEKQISEWVDRQIEKVGGLDNKVEQNLQQLNDLYYPALEDFQKYRTDAEGALSHSKEELQISLRDVETLSARLEYEFNSLRSKVEDVEEGVAEFERQVLLVQDRFREVVKPTEEAKGWSSWLSRLLKGRTSNQWNPPSEATM